MITAGFVVCLSLLFSAQWDTNDGQPLRTWDWAWWSMRQWAPPPGFRRWFIRVSPGLVIAGLLTFIAALLFLR